jgi:hypothetical protein
VRQLNEEFRDLENCYKSESSRRRRKYSPAEAAGRRQLVSQLAEEIAAVKTLQKRQYMESYRDPSSQVKSMEDAELFSHGEAVRCGERSDGERSEPWRGAASEASRREGCVRGL